MVAERELPDGWDFTPEQRPPRSALRSAEPIGLGTAWVESLSGYLARVARAHSLSPRALLERVVPAAHPDLGEVGSNREDLALLARRLLERPSASINGAWGTAQIVTQLLARLTMRTDLAALSLLPWGGFLIPRQLLRTERAYCPVCLDEWHRAGQPLYEPLRWQLQALEVCVRHRVTLRTGCPNPGCRNRRSVLTGWARAGSCGLCGAPLWLGADEAIARDRPIGPDVLDWQTFVDAEVGSMLADPPVAGESRDPDYPAVLQLAIERARSLSQRAFAQQIGMTESSVSYWKDAARQPSLIALLRVCRAGGFRLRDALVGDIEVLRSSEPPNATPFILHSTETHRVLDSSEMERVLREALTAYPPPTMASVYADLRVDQRHLRRRQPVLCKAVRERRAAYDAERAASRRAERARVLVEAIHLLHRQGIYPSRNQLHQVLPHHVRLQEERLRLRWRRELALLGYCDPSAIRRVLGRPARTPLPTALRRRRAVVTDG